MTLLEITQKINHLSMKSKRPLEQLQRLRYSQYKHRPRTWKPFAKFSTISDEGYAFHAGGMTELQFNIGNKDATGNGKFRYGVAFSFKPSRNAPDPIAELKPVVTRFNNFVMCNPSFFHGHEMWIWNKETGNKLYSSKVIPIKDDLIKQGNFIFIGKFIDKKQDDITDDDIEMIVNEFEYLFQVYQVCQFGLKMPIYSRRIRNLIAGCKFHPVGQGGFYSGKIRDYANNESYTFVYDCGTLSSRKYITKEIECFKSDLRDDELDLLIISHFHADHVNCVKQLLEGVHCKKLIIPYYDPTERLFLGATGETENEEYFQVLRDPIDFFSSAPFDIDEIIVIDSDGDFPREQFIREEGWYSNDFIDEDYNEYRKQKIERLETNGSYSNKVKITREYGIYLFGRQWEFVFYQNKIDSKVLSKFMDDVDVIVSKNRNIRNLFTPDNIGIFRQLYTSHIANKFRDVKHNFNNTSLVVYHGPYGPKHRAGTLLTGDISLKKDSVVKDITDHLGKRIKNIKVLQVPHHGSEENWCSSSPLPLPLQEECCYVVFHGLKRAKHPSIEVLDHITKQCSGVVRLVNEFTEFEYTIYV